MGAKIGIATFLAVLLLIKQQVHGQFQFQQVEEAEEVCATINEGSCDPFKGKWVFDDSYPLSESNKCQLIFMLDRNYLCEANGRLDTDYRKYRWQPNDCDLPRFDAEDFVVRFRGKKIMFVGEHLGYNQLQSLVCMLYSSLPPTSFGSGQSDGFQNVTFSNYNVEILFSPSPFLVDLENKVLKLDTIDKISATTDIGKAKWTDADVLIFNSWYSWLSTTDKLWNTIEDGNKTVTEMDPLVAYEKGLNTWAKWVDDNIDPSKTTVFFQGTSPDHWNINNEDGNTCAGVTQPASKASPSETIVAGQKIVEKVLGKMTNPVYFLNITNLSQLRPDGHPSKYGPLPNQNDCIYWCLSGVADTWNQLLYAFLLQLSN